jgi:hypothetical protein
MGNGRFTRRITPLFLESVTPPPSHAFDRVLLYEFDTGRPSFCQVTSRD